MIKAFLLAAFVSAYCQGWGAIVPDGFVFGKFRALAPEGVLVNDLANHPKENFIFSARPIAGEHQDNIAHNVRSAELVRGHIFADFPIWRHRPEVSEFFLSEFLAFIQPFIRPKETSPDVICGCLSEITQGNTRDIDIIVKDYVSSFYREIGSQLLCADLLRDSHGIVSGAHRFTSFFEGSLQQADGPNADKERPQSSKRHCPLCPAIPKNDAGYLLRLILGIWGAAIIMFGAGFVSWEGDRWLDWRWLYGGLSGGLLLSGLWLYFWLGFIFLSL